MNIEHVPAADHCPVPQRIHTFMDAWVEWLSGNKFPVAFLGDSTVDGANTTDWVRNTIGTDNISPNAFSKKLEGMLRQATNNDKLRIYNAGFSGQIASWAVNILDQEFAEDSPYGDVRMVGIGFGINDRLAYPDEKAYREQFKGYIKQMIEWCYARNIQPFLITTQAVVNPGVRTDYTEAYPMRTGEMINSIANEVKRELADELGLQLIDLNKYTEKFLLYSSSSAHSIISDKLHFGDIGHQYEADVIFSHLAPRTIIVDGYSKIDYSSQKVTNCVPEDWIVMPPAPTDSFKVMVDCTKDNEADTKIMSAWVFVNSKKALTLKAYRTHSSDTYIKVNGIAKALTGFETVVDQLELGLHRLEVYTGASAKVDFKGFILE
ncbi:MAG: hypothetical protein K0R67_1123 [Paenibacillus sp.]|nr:hypothetical protein [Paenibacillus sp.]